MLNLLQIISFHHQFIIKTIINFNFNKHLFSFKFLFIDVIKRFDKVAAQRLKKKRKDKVS